MKPDLVSVIITTKNSENHIAKCLSSVQKQIYTAIEIIVVDNNSRDKTKTIACRYTKKVFGAGRERSSQRNFAVKKSRGTYLLFLDSDMFLHKKTVEACVSYMEKNSSIAGLYIPEIISGASLFARIRNFERSFYDATVIDAVRFVRKDVFLKTKGFDERLYAAEDWDFTKRVKKYGEIHLAKIPLFHNDSQATIFSYLKKKSYYAKNLHEYIKKWGKNDPDIMKQFGLYYRFFGVFTENGKWKRLVSFPFLSIGIIGLKILVGIIYIVQIIQNL